MIPEKTAIPIIRKQNIHAEPLTSHSFDTHIDFARGRCGHEKKDFIDHEGENIVKKESKKSAIPSGMAPGVI